jgi:limonene-1,2-epoxide hydrolase
VTPTEVVQTFVEHFNQNRIADALDMLAEDVLYHNIPMEPITGREAVRAFNDDFGLGTRIRTNWELLAIAQSGDVVLTERTDEFFSADGRRIAIPVMGSFRVRDGFIAEWRDYFDLGDLTTQLGALNNPTDGDDIEHHVGQKLNDRSEPGRD